MAKIPFYKTITGPLWGGSIGDKETTMQDSEDFVAVSLNKLLNKQVRGWWNESP